MYLDLNEQQVVAVIAGLKKLPYEVAAPLLGLISAQMKAQMQPQKIIENPAPQKKTPPKNIVKMPKKKKPPVSKPDGSGDGGQ